MRTLVEGRNYEFLDILVDNDRQTTPIRILNGKYKGLIFQYGQVSITEDPPTLHFDYQIIDNPANITEDQALQEYLGDLFVNYISDPESNVDHSNNRSNNTQKSTKE